MIVFNFVGALFGELFCKDVPPNGLIRKFLENLRLGNSYKSFYRIDNAKFFDRFDYLIDCDTYRLDYLKKIKPHLLKKIKNGNNNTESFYFYRCIG